MFEPTEEQQSIREMVRDFSENVLKPNAEHADRTEEYPAEAVKGLAEMGIMSINVPEEYDGAALDEVCKAIAIEETGRCCAGWTAGASAWRAWAWA